MPPLHPQLPAPLGSGRGYWSGEARSDCSDARAAINAQASFRVDRFSTVVTFDALALPIGRPEAGIRLQNGVRRTTAGTIDLIGRLAITHSTFPFSLIWRSSACLTSVADVPARRRLGPDGSHRLVSRWYRKRA